MSRALEGGEVKDEAEAISEELTPRNSPNQMEGSQAERLKHSGNSKQESSLRGKRCGCQGRHLSQGASDHPEQAVVLGVGDMVAGAGMEERGLP